MPNLMPGKPGTKEAFGISEVYDDFTIVIPPKALKHYGISDRDVIFLVTGQRGKSGFGMMKKETALNTVFKKYLNEIVQLEKIYWGNKRAFIMLEIKNGLIHINEDILKAFFITIGDKLMVAKSTTLTMSFTPVEVWIDIFNKHGFSEAIENMKTLPVF
ncbi:MAG: hypothetical protein JW822_08165 [Spirochaetales bacterium]|nr:hypothetical protein [Spirochaetales bacterium]